MLLRIKFSQLVSARGLDGVPEAPTAREARHQARADLVAKHGEPRDRLAEIGLGSMVDAEVERTAPERREARERAARERLLALADALLEAAAELGWPGPESGRAREIVATLLGLVIVRGAGGPGDLGGLRGRSALPIVGGIRAGAGWGPAWVAAFSEATRALFAEWRPRCCDTMELLLDNRGDLVVSCPIGQDGFGVNHRLNMGIVHPGVWRLLANPIDSTATGREQPVWVAVPEFGAVELDGAPANHPYILAGAIALGRDRGAVSVRDWHGNEAGND